VIRRSWKRNQKSNVEIAGETGCSVTHLSRKFRKGIEELQRLGS